MLRRIPIFIFLFSCTFLPAQQYNFHNYSVADGLAQSQVYAMAEDVRGYLWLGTRGGGLSRFDGTQFVNYTEDDGLTNNFIDCITTDSKGNLWIGTDEGLCEYDGAHFKTISLPGGVQPVNAILIGNDDRVYVGTGNSGLIVLQNGDTVAHFSYKSGLPSYRVYCLSQDDDGTTWIGTEMGLVSMKNNIRKTYTHADGLPVNAIRSIVRDHSGTLWCATYGGGLCFLDGDQFKKFDNDDGLTNNTTQCMICDHAGRLWIGTASGVTRIDENKNVKQFSETEGLCSNVVMSLLEDSWGNTWFGTSGGGVCMLDGERFIHFNEKSGDMGPWVYALHCDKKGNMWFGTSSGGVTEYDGMYYTKYFQSAGFTTAKVKAIGEDTTGTMWFGTVGDGAYSFSKGSFHHYHHADGMSGNYVNAFITDSLNREWMATAGGGISVYDPRTQSFLRIGAKQGLISDHIYIPTLAKDHDGNIWVGSTSYGIFEMQYDSSGISVKKHFDAQDGLPGNSVRSATCDRYGNMWFGTTDGGVSRFDGKKFRNYSKNDSLASNNIYLLLADRAGNLWVGTEKGLDKIAYDAAGNILSLRHYAKGEGLYGIETSQNAACLDTSSGVWFGTISGASVYHPENDYITRIPPFTHITGIRLFFDPIENTPYGKKDGGYNWFPVPDSLVLPYTQNSLRFEFTGIDLRNPDGVRFRWMLIGFDKKWTPENDERQATYSNLPPGDYVFAVQARNSDGFRSEVQRFRFSITPPVWATWPFRISAGVFVLLVLFGLFRWRVYLLQKKNKTQLEKITLEKHVLELEQKALRLQMNPHFIFNALQSIQGFIARNDSAEARRYLAKFGKLMRLTLENSRTSYTSIAQETESLQHYLELEALCHGNRFTFSIEVDSKIDPEATFIPVMLIQPFVENAVLHGMRHLENKEGKIMVRFIRQFSTGARTDSVVCEIEDNGVGRKKSAELESSATKEHKSAAMEITGERLAQLNEENKPESKFEIIDLQNSDGTASGTKVVITIGNVIWE